MKNIIINCLLLLGIISQGCKKQLDIPPRTSLDANGALSTKAGMDAAVNSVYSVLKGLRLYGRDMFAVADALADISFANGRSNRLINENRIQNLANMANWGTSYSALNEINLNLEAVPSVTNASAADKTRWTGELSFLRALYHFDLVKNYAYIPTYVVEAQNRGGVVLALEGFDNAADAVNYRPKRATIAECYNQIMADLYVAIANLSNANKGRNFASKHAALALGSRVALYAGQWARADSFATAAITLTGGIGTMTNTGNYVSGWRAADHPEGIFQVWYATLPENLGVNESLAATHTTLAAPGALNSPRQGQGDLVPNLFLITQLGITGVPSNLVGPASNPPALTYSNDIRNRLYEWGVNAAGRYVECTKWLGKNGNPNWDNSVVIRWPELYLNRAEARFQLNNEVGAVADLNFIRTARYTGFTPPATPETGAALLAEILKQRMLEFAFEGYRWYDLKRYGMTITKTNPVVTMPATDFRLLPRIPLNEIEGNPNMQQNFGY
jgi:starch-binding outer membrane protein, SusD/RagB family